LEHIPEESPTRRNIMRHTKTSVIRNQAIMMREMQLDQSKYANDKIIFEKLGKAITNKITNIEK